jgi:hypothetical protein
LHDLSGKVLEERATANDHAGGYQRYLRTGQRFLDFFDVIERNRVGAHKSWTPEGTALVNINGDAVWCFRCEHPFDLPAIIPFDLHHRTNSNLTDAG